MAKEFITGAEVIIVVVVVVVVAVVPEEPLILNEASLWMFVSLFSRFGDEE